MPTILSHPAVPLTLGLALGRSRIGPRLLLAGAAASVVPDLDVLGFRFGVAYSDPLGHRGMTHSLAFAALLASLALLAARPLRSPRAPAFLFVFAAAASHGLLDMLTNGGLGVALFWPLSSDRFFFPRHPIEVSPLSLHRILSPAGLAVFRSELLWIWLPCAALGLVAWMARRKRMPG